MCCGRTGKTGPTCRNCRAKDLCDAYEQQLFSFRDTRKGADANLLFGLDGSDVAARLAGDGGGGGGGDDGGAFGYKEAGYAFRASAEAHAVLSKVSRAAPLSCHIQASTATPLQGESCRATVDH